MQRWLTQPRLEVPGGASAGPEPDKDPLDLTGEEQDEPMGQEGEPGRGDSQDPPNGQPDEPGHRTCFECGESKLKKEFVQQGTKKTPRWKCKGCNKRAATAARATKSMPELKACWKELTPGEKLELQGLGSKDLKLHLEKKVTFSKVEQELKKKGLAEKAKPLSILRAEGYSEAELDNIKANCETKWNAKIGAMTYYVGQHQRSNFSNTERNFQSTWAPETKEPGTTEPGTGQTRDTQEPGQASHSRDPDTMQTPDKARNPRQTRDPAGNHTQEPGTGGTATKDPAKQETTGKKEKKDPKSPKKAKRANKRDKDR